MQDVEATTHLFVYGTLRREAPMHGLLSEGVRFIAKARARGSLYDMGAYPAFVEAAEGTSRVSGELFELTGDPVALLDVLDRYEGESFDRSVSTVTTEDGRDVRAFLYHFLGDASQGQRIESGDYLASLAEGVRARAGRGSLPD